MAESSRQNYMKEFIPNIQRNAKPVMARMEWAKRKMPAAYRFIRQIGTYRMKKVHFGQVVPLEDAEAVIDMVQSVTRIACVCRSVTAGSNNSRYCMLLGVDPENMSDGFADLRGSLETIAQSEAKELLQKFDTEGLVHSIWTFKTPFIGAICNCDHDCLAYKIQVSSDLMEIMFKAEYLAEINLSECVGRRSCQKLCQFGAIEYSAATHKCYINVSKCYGCGVCRNGCKKAAISLTDKA